MKNLIVLMFISFGMTAQAVSLNDFSGRYRSNGGQGPIYIDVTPTNNSLVLDFSSGAWNTRIKGNSYDFICEGNECSAYVHELEQGCIAGLKLLENGSFVMSTLTPSLCKGSHRFTRYLGPVGKGRWSVAQKVNRDGVLTVTATVENKKKKNSLLMQCKAPSADLTMSIKVNELLWRALNFSVNNRQESAKVIMQVSNKSFEFTNLNLEQENLIIRSDKALQPEIEALKKGLVAKVRVLTTNNAGEDTELDQFNFSLRGSARALSELPKKCQPSVENSSNSTVLQFVE